MALFVAGGVELNLGLPVYQGKTQSDYITCAEQRGE
jgi:hypothetical protein